MDAINKTNEYIRTRNLAIDNLLEVVDAQLRNNTDPVREVILIIRRNKLLREKLTELK